MIARMFPAAVYHSLSFAIFRADVCVYTSPLFTDMVGTADLSTVAAHGGKLTDGFLPTGKRILRCRFSLLGDPYILLVILPRSEHAGSASDPVGWAEQDASPVTDPFRALLQFADPQKVHKRPVSQAALYRILSEKVRAEISDRIEFHDLHILPEERSALLDPDGFLAAAALLFSELCLRNTDLSVSIVQEDAHPCFRIHAQNTHVNSFLLTLIRAVCSASGACFSSSDQCLSLLLPDYHADVYLLRADVDYGNTLPFSVLRLLFGVPAHTLLHTPL